MSDCDSPNLKTQFNQCDFTIEHRETVFQGFFKMERLSVHHKSFDSAEKIAVQRELFVRGDAAAAIMYDPDHNLVALIEQFRIGALKQTSGPWCLEVVAGMIEEDETPKQVIARELEEEANMMPKRLDYIGNYLSSPGGTDEKLHLFCAICDLRHAEGVFGLDSEGEDIRVRVFDADKLLATLYTDGLIGDQPFNNAATLICLQWLYCNKANLNQD